MICDRNYMLTPFEFRSWSDDRVIDTRETGPNAIEDLHDRSPAERWYHTDPSTGRWGWTIIGKYGTAEECGEAFM
jgi:hypothetical protein